MPIFEKGAVVRVPFPFPFPFPYTDRSTRQHRPALVVSAGGVGEAAELLWVVMITSAENRPWPGDVPLGAEYRKTGLPAPSVIRPCKIATIEARLAEPIGAVSRAISSKVDGEVRKLLGSV